MKTKIYNGILGNIEIKDTVFVSYYTVFEPNQKPRIKLITKQSMIAKRRI